MKPDRIPTQRDPRHAGAGRKAREDSLPATVDIREQLTDAAGTDNDMEVSR